ncbi:MAG: hypothetical protein ACM3X1_02830 [Ignavibacteriales bacterium]
MLLGSAEAVLSIFGFSRSLYGFEEATLVRRNTNNLRETLRQNLNRI